MNKLTKKLLVAATALTVSIPLFANTLTTYACESVSACQTQLEQLQADNATAQKQLDQAQTIFGSAQTRVDAAQALANSIQTEIDAYDATIISLNEQITTLEAQIAELEADIEAKQLLLRERLVDLQIRSKTNQFLDFLISSESLSDLLSRTQSIQQLNAYDTELIKEIEAQQAEIEGHQAEIEATKVEAENLKAQANTRAVEQAAVLATLQAERQALALEVYGAQGIVDSLGLSSSDIQAQMDILAAASAASGSTSEVTPSVSGFYRPTTGVTTLGHLSQEYPYSASRPHLGIDIGASEGTPVVSITDGVVISASSGYNGGYGNMVVISHNVNGTPMVSIYAHLSSIGVSTGQSVSGGTYIGAVGNTGDSFGAHLHIELLSGISYMPASREERMQYAVNPANYF